MGEWDVERRTNVGMKVLGVLIVVLVISTEWLAGGLPLLLFLIASIIVLAVTQMWQGLDRESWRKLLQVIGALMITSVGVVMAGEAAADLYSHKTHGGNMDFGTVGSQYQSAVVGLLLAFGMWGVAYAASRQLVERRQWQQIARESSAET